MEFISKMLPEHMRKTSRMELVCDDLHMLPRSEIMRIAEWLIKKVDSVTLKTCAEPEEAEVSGAGHATYEGRCHHDTQGGRSSGENLKHAVQKWELGPL